MTSRPPNLTVMAAVWLALIAGSAASFAQDTCPPLTPVALPGAPAPPQGSLNPPEEKRSENAQPISYGAELKLGSGYADRGLVISDRLVIQPVTWVSGRAGTLSVWSNDTLVETADRSRPQILDLELSRARQWGNLTLEPAIEMFFYRDPVSLDSSRSIESWVYLSYRAGPLRLFTNHSVDVLAAAGAYFGEAGIASDRRVSSGIEVGGSLSAGWASSRFNDARVGIDKSAFNLVSTEAWLTAHLTQHFYVRPHVQFSTIIDRAVRAELAQPTVFLVGLATGVEF